MENTITLTSSQKLANFLEEKNVSKKEFAKMIGVTLSYVYNLANNDLPFTTRVDTIEKVAVVMGVKPTEFEEYIEPCVDFHSADHSARAKYLQIRGDYTISNLDLVRKIYPKFQVDFIDILRGAKEIPPDITFIRMIMKALTDRSTNSIDTAIILEAAMVSAFKQAGTLFDIDNTNMIKKMVQSYMEV
jgi:transcriptional regulator with XRE-family HTH domain